MPYISCYQGNIHSRYEQSEHVKQVIFLKNNYKDNIPVYIELIRCDKKESNIKEIQEYQPIPYMLIFGLIIFHILIFYIIKKLTD